MPNTRRPTGVAEADPTAPAHRLPPHAYFVVSAAFHYLGPALAFLLFAKVAPLGVAWLRIVGAGVVFACWRRPWRAWFDTTPSGRRTLLALGITLAAMNTCFYLGIAALPLGTVGAVEFLGPVALAAVGVRTRRNLAALLVAVGGVAALTDVSLHVAPLGLACSFANCALFVVYVVLGHRIARHGGATGVDRLGAAMLVASLAVTPIGIADAMVAFVHPLLLAAGLGVAICSSVIPYVCDQLAMARLPRATFALLMALLPAMAAIIGVVVLRQLPTPKEVIGVAAVVSAVAIHRDHSDGED